MRAFYDSYTLLSGVLAVDKNVIQIANIYQQIKLKEGSIRSARALEECSHHVHVDGEYR